MNNTNNEKQKHCVKKISTMCTKNMTQQHPSLFWLIS